MSNQEDAAGPAKNADPWMGLILFIMVALVASAIALTRGLTWKGLLHWCGELLLIAGIILAAKGISDVRREWTELPGFWGSVKPKMRVMRVRAASVFWARWNRVVRWVARRGWLATRLRLRAHGTSAYVGLAGAAASAGAATGTVEVVWGAPPAGGTIEDRLAWLETHMARVGQQLRMLEAWHSEEVRVRQADTDKERAARIAGDQHIRERMADLAGGGLKLQAWGVGCLLAGTVLTAIW